VSTVTIYTDGACKGKTKIGGWGAHLEFNGKTKEIFGGEKDTTNNKMKLTAVIEALRCLKRACKIELWTDSEYVKSGSTEWVHNWKKRGWKTASGSPVKNKELWVALEGECNKHNISWHWFKGHSGDVGNEKADDLANKGVEQILNAT